MRIIKIAFLFLTSISFAQETSGYWDKERITNKEIKLSAGERIIIKSEDFPDGTTEFVYRITLLDENQKMVSDLSSVLKAIPDPYFIGKGTGGAIDLASAISGTDKCTYAIFSNNPKAIGYSKTGDFKTACLYQNNPVSKEVKVISIEKSTCLVEDSKSIWFGFESKNWILGQKIILEIVPWVNNIASRGWTKKNKETVLSTIYSVGLNQYIRKSEKVEIGYKTIELISKEYRFNDFQKLSPQEQKLIIDKQEESAFTYIGRTDLYNEIQCVFARKLAKEGKIEEGIDLINNKVIGKPNATALNYNSLAELYIKSKQFEKSLKTLKIAENLDSSELLVQLNLAHTYMFLDKMSESREIHNKYKEQNVSTNQTWKNKTINDLDKFQKANLPNDNFKKVLRLVD